MKKLLLISTIFFCTLMNAKADNNIVLATYGNPTDNEELTLTVALNHDKNYADFSFRLEFPDGVTVDSYTLQEPLIQNNTTFTCTKRTTASTGKVWYRIVGYNDDFTAIGGESGDIILVFKLKCSTPVAYNALNFEAKYINFTYASDTYTTENPGDDFDNVTTSYCRLWGDVNHDDKVDLTDIEAATTATLSGSAKHNLDHFATSTGIEGAFEVVDIANIIKYAKQ